MNTLSKVWVWTAVILIAVSMLVGSTTHSDPNGELNPLTTWALFLGAVGFFMVILFGLGCVFGIITDVAHDIVTKDEDK